MRRIWCRAPVFSTLAVVGILCGLGAACGADSGTEPLPPASLADLFGDVLYRADGSTVGVAGLQGVPLIGVYFAAQSCPACEAFSPALIEVYGQLRQEGRAFEVVMVSGDPSETHMFAHMLSYDMPWLAVPWGSPKASGLVQRWGIQWVPTLVVIDGSARTVSTDGRAELTQKGILAYDDWLAAASR